MRSKKEKSVELENSEIKQIELNSTVEKEETLENETKPKKCTKKKDIEVSNIDDSSKEDSIDEIEAFKKVEDDAINTLNKNAKKEMKKEKAIKFLDELKAFLILAVIIAIVVGSVWIWYTHFYDKDRKPNDGKINTGEQVVDNYDVISYTTDNEIKVIGNYLIEYNRNTLLKIMDLRTNTICNENIEFTSFIIGIDGNLYIYLDELVDEENILYLYKFDGKTMELLFNITEAGVYNSLILYQDNETKYLMGVASVYGSEDDYYVKNTTINYLDGTTYELKKQVLIGDKTLKTETSPIITYNRQYIVSKKNNEVGLFDYIEKEMEIDYKYDRLTTSLDGNYIAVKDNKTGIINTKLKKIVDFKYDDIKSYNDFYVIENSNKVALMNNNYKLVTDFVFSKENSEVLDAYKINDKYILIINSDSNCFTYIINADGTYNTLENSHIYYNKNDDFIYSYDLEKKEYTIYNQDLTIRYNLNISDYDYSDIPKLYLVNGNTIVIDEASELYFNYEDGKMIDNFNNYETELDGIKLSFNGKKKIVELKKDNETLKYTFEYSYQNHKLYEEKDNTIYYIMNNKYIAFVKGE